jgi:hypothetical protein
MGDEQNRGLNWKQILATAVVTGLVGVSTGMILFFFQQRQPKLSYQVADTIPFMGDKERLAIHNIVVKNSGKELVKNVDCSISLSPSKIKEKRISADSSLKYNDSVAGSTYTFHVDNLNPEEKITVSILSSSNNEIPQRPTISLRGEGVKGEEATDKDKKSIWESPISTAMISAYAVVLVLYTVFRLFVRRSHVFDDGPLHQEEQNKILAYLFGLHGLTSEAEIYLQKTQDSAYWSEADRIAATAIKANDAHLSETLKKVLIMLLKYGDISPTSIGVIHYNIARICMALDQSEESQEHLVAARKTIPKLLEKRLQLDPLFMTNNK